jgi:cyclophilin family peptidyl-prolyl cis-trans isomerase
MAAAFLMKGTTLMAADTDTVAVVETKFGKMVIEFYGKDAPKTVANFIKLAKDGYYNGTTFHRVIPAS